MKDLSKLNNAGVFGVYTMEKGTLMVFMFKDTKLYCSLIGTKVVVPEKFKDHADDIKDLFDYVRVAFGVPKSNQVNIRDFDVSAGEMKVEEVYKAPKGYTPASMRNVKPFLEAEGFDCSSLEKTLPDPDPILDYSDLLANSQVARDTFDRIKGIVDGRKAILAPEYLPIAEAIKHGKNRLIYLVGPAGTGKTMLSYLFSQYCGAPLITYQGSEGVEKDELIGCSDVNPDAKAGESPYRIVMGPLLRAYIEGWQIVIDEANYLLPSIMSCINSMVDDTPTYEFKGTVYKRHPNFVLYLTSNPGYEGTYGYNPATKSRGLTLLIDKLSPSEFAKRMIAYTDGKLKKDFFIQLNKVANQVQEFSQQYGESSAVCLRHAQNFANLCLAKPLTREEFDASFRCAYMTNALSMDQDNGAKIADCMNNVEFKSMLETLFGLYDYAEAPDKDPEENFADFVGEELSMDEPTASASIDDKKFEDEFNSLFSV